MNERIFAVAHYADQAVLILLVILSLASLAMILERYFTLGKVVKVSRRHQRTLEGAIREGDLSRVRSIADDTHSLEGRAVAYAMMRMDKGSAEGIDEVFSAITQVEKPRLERSLGFLATVGSNAPYIGLFGTVLGIMKSFNDMAGAADGGQSTVMAGISSALIATAAGLMVAIPAVLAYNYFQKQVKVVTTNLDTCRQLILAWFKQKEA
jgi:biopolymer transport protein TolQ